MQPAVAYSLFSGFVALVAGAAVSLMAGSTSIRLIVWITVSGAIAIAAGVAYETKPFKHLLARCQIWLKCLLRQ